MSSKVYFYNMKNHHHVSPINKFEGLARKFDLGSIFGKDELTAVKLHFGEPGNTSFIRPLYAKRMVAILKSLGARPFITDTNTLYYGQRSNSVDHLDAAIGNGFAYAVVDAPLIIGDGLTGKDFVNVPIEGRHFKEVKIGSNIYYADSMAVISHFKGHEMTGFGGTLKNLSMGCASRAGKQMMHSTVKPWANPAHCVSCGKCVANCPVKAISITTKSSKRFASIDSEVCYGCGECVVTCPTKAIKINWQTDVVSMQERMADFVAGAVKNKVGKILYFNFLVDMSPCCDCYGFNDTPMKDNIGILASTDPVAIDQAGLDLLGEDLLRKIYPDIDSSVQISSAEALGLGSRQYELEEI